MAHETIKTLNQAVHVLTGTIVDIIDDVPIIGCCHVRLDKYPLPGEEIKNIPVFYHCQSSETIDATSNPFIEDDRVLIVNYGSTISAEDMKIVGYEDGLPRSCGWRFKLYRDDDTTVRYLADEGEHKKGDIKKASGLLLNSQQISYINIINSSGNCVGGIDSNAPGSWGEDYWTLTNGIWYYDDSIDYPDDAWTGSYTPETGYFTVNFTNTYIPISGDTYWIVYGAYDEIKKKIDPVIDDATSALVIDAYTGVIITLSEAGKSQTLQNPTNLTKERTFVVKSSEWNGSNNIIVNGITLSAGKVQGFAWNGSKWKISDDDFIYAPPTYYTSGGQRYWQSSFVEMQYPYRYKTEDKLKAEDRIPIGTYGLNIPYWETCFINVYSVNRGYMLLPEPIDYGSSGIIDCDDYSEFGIQNPNKGPYAFWKSNFTVFNWIKTSIPYNVTYRVYKRYHYPFGKRVVGEGTPETRQCGQALECGGISQSGTPLHDLITYVSGDSLFSKTHTQLSSGWTWITGDWQDIPGSIKTENQKNIKLTNNKSHTGYYYSCTIWNAETEEWDWSEVSTTLDFIRHYRAEQIRFDYE